MKFYLLLISSFLFAEPSKEIFNKLQTDRENGLTRIEKVNILSNNTTEENKELKSSLYIESIKNEISKQWKISNGYAKLSFIIDTNSGKIVKTLVSEKQGNDTFTLELNRFIKDVANLNLSKENLSNPILEVFISFGSKEKKEVKVVKNDLSLYSNEKNRYKDLLSYFINVKGVSKEQIKKELNKQEHSLIKNLLFGVYYEFEKKDMKTAVENYEFVVSRFLEHLVKTKEAFYITDYLIQTKRFKEILFIFPERSCPLYQDIKYKNECYYYQSVAKYFLKQDYEMALNSIKDLKKAEEFKTSIKNGEFK